MIVTVLGMSLAELLVLAIVSYVMFREERFFPERIAAELASFEEAARAELARSSSEPGRAVAGSGATPDAISSDGRLGLLLQSRVVVGRPGFELAVDLGNREQVRPILLRSDASSSIESRLAQGGIELADPVASERLLAVVNHALAGKSDVAGLSRRLPGGRILAATPVRDAATREPIGALLLDIDFTGELGAFFASLPTALLPSAIGILLFGAAVGYVFGHIASSNLTRRIEAIGSATAAWERGELGVRIPIHGEDELGELAHRMEGMAARLAELLDERRDVAAMEERDRIARELHDSVKQHLFALTMRLEAARVDPKAHLEHAIRLATRAQGEIAAMIEAVDPPDLAEKPLDEAVRSYAEEWSRSYGIATSVECTMQRPPEPHVARELFRLTQEALANAARHSGATSVRVQLRVDAEQSEIRIEDDGRGFDGDGAVSRGGLAGMRQRMDRLQGDLEIDSAPGSGTRIRASVEHAPEERR